MSEDKRLSGHDGGQTGRSVGSPVTRVDAADKVTGRAAYVDDLSVPGMLHAALVFPGCAHAELKGVDAGRALSMRGVHAVLTASDIPGENQVGVIDADQPLLPHSRIRYTGDAVAIVVADSPSLARDAAGAVRLDLAELPAVFDAEEALSPDAPSVHDDGNLLLHYKVRKGDVQAGFEEADVIVERTFRTHHQEHAYLEPLGAVAVPEDGGTITVYGTLQCPFYVQKAVATTLGLPLSAVRVVQTVTGGGFGGKEDVPSEICACAAVAAWRVRRPVKLVYTREEDFYRSSKRHPMTVEFKLGARRDGTFTAAQVRVVADAGAYSTLTQVVAFRAAAHATGPYEIPNVRTDVLGVYTNRQTTGAFRGFGQPQVIFANESVVDEVAGALGLDPIDIRLKNGLDVGRLTATGQLLTESVGLRDTLTAARDASGWTEKRRRAEASRSGANEGDSDGSSAGVAPLRGGVAEPRGGTVRRGIGVASIYYGVSLGAKGLALDASGAHLNVYRDGSVRVSVGGTEMGQGLLTVLSQIASDSLGIPMDRIHVGNADTSVVPDSGPSVASRTTLMTGNAVIDAAARLRLTMGAVAADVLGVTASDVTFEGDTVGAGETRMPFPELANECWRRNVSTSADGWYAAPETHFDENGQGDAYAVYSFATHVAEVAVDVETGRVTLERITAAHDVGRVLNPVTLEGQIEGGALQGASMALYERMVTSGGDILTPDFSTYILPTSMDVPEIVPLTVEAPYSLGPFGAKGMGETPAMPGAAAVANAVADATGVRVTELPIDAATIARAFENAGPDKENR
ncbi:MAG: xanthine dehydrogenase family protein molybdopterin-binding subunit [Candidatus Eisenbacteria bacterium]